MSAMRMFHRIHPLVAVAAVTVSLFSLLGIAAITGVLPSSYGNNSSSASSAAVPPAQAATEDWDPNKPVQKNPQAKHSAQAQPNAVAKTTKEVTAQQNPSVPVQTAHKPAPQNSPVGIGVGALIGGVLGNQIGSGDGKTLATIAGAIGGGYVGNEVAKKNQQP
jgi:uncharacterized protein YcfJ